MLCGAMANKYGAQMIDSIDTRITNRAVVISGGVGGNMPQSIEDREDRDRDRDSDRRDRDRDREDINAGQSPNVGSIEDLRVAARRGRMPSISIPKLIRS
jgi:hypothetical protein